MKKLYWTLFSIFNALTLVCLAIYIIDMKSIKVSEISRLFQMIDDNKIVTNNVDILADDDETFKFITIEKKLDTTEVKQKTSTPFIERENSTPTPSILDVEKEPVKQKTSIPFIGRENSTQTPSILDVEKEPRNPEWEQINRYTFFRRNYAFYFIDTLALRSVYFTHKIYENHTYEVELLVYDKLSQNLLSKIYLNNNSFALHDEKHVYRMFSIDISNLNFSNYNIERIDLKLFLIDKNNKSNILRTKYPIDVIKTNWIGRGKSGSMVCSACFFYYGDKIQDHSNLYFFKQFQWWFELNKRIGHKKIVIYNTSIPNLKIYNDLFDKYSGFVEIKNLRFLPNYLYSNENEYSDYEHKYLNSFEKLDIWRYFAFLTLVLNECYLTNKHLYNYISVVDQDEIVLPRVNKLVGNNMKIYHLVKDLDLKNISDKQSLNKILNIESSCSNGNNQNQDVELYMDNLKKTYNINQNISFTFSMSYYLSFESVELILKKFDELLKEKNNTIENFPAIIKFDDPYYKNYTYHFILNNQNDVNYIKNLIKIYNLLIKKFIFSKKNILDQYSQQFNRYFYLGGDISSHALGKTIHNTNETSELHTHFAVKGNSYNVNHNDGANSHFRIEYSFRENQTIEIKDLVLDFNYFYCYYRHVLKHFTSLDIVIDDL